MKNIILGFLIFLVLPGFSQNLVHLEHGTRKGKLYFYWGWNRDSFSKSTINFTSPDYDFTLEKLVANDRQSAFAYDPYFKITRVTIPQYNFRVGYFFKNNWDISFGIDHMKYVVQPDQVVKISGNINNTQTPYDGTYDHDDIAIASDFLQFEHTDGLNFINVELRRFNQLMDLNNIKVNITGGMGMGMLYPKTNVTLLNNERNDAFHVAGYSIDAMAGINVAFFEIFFIQSELKGGFINLPDIRTTPSMADGASQHFFFSQVNIVFGGIINLNHKKISK